MGEGGGWGVIIGMDLISLDLYTVYDKDIQACFICCFIIIYLSTRTPRLTQNCQLVKDVKLYISIVNVD